jgi:hypothetical protein
MVKRVIADIVYSGPVRGYAHKSCRLLSFFPLFIFDVICRKSEMLRLVRTSAISSFTGTYRSEPLAFCELTL